ncbi:uncharacterized protein THITE_2123799 [Thermothielavioides terrestris NRRL 8126]|uniref:Uncharacterized protein n=1 Tax=Thermothielavioides terrestris (strain ATCC 38088 / NRRL 8126) TaxID=578455 RepID=G2RHY2_THETT|nr:uncharacterized protein THITE_2123799 [Thermothielavioides terrestris NRRL 8126]AEO71444.1 hypothetical protein THITE_2123799 [Thermothielavioides terrestris NRRL 8126]
MQYRTNHGREQVSAAARQGGRQRKAPAKVPQGHFDPDELTRRLYMVLAEQKAQAERKQRAQRRGSAPSSTGTRHREDAKPDREGRQQLAEPRADLITEWKRSEPTKRKPPHAALAVPASDASGSQPTQYHHVPSQAAKQFTATATADNMRDSSLVHKLSKHALKFHLEGPRAARPAAGGSGGGGGGEETALAPAELTRALRQSQAQHNKLLGRNQFQRTRTLEQAARLEHAQHQQQLQSPREHTFEAELSRLLPDGHKPASWWHTRRNSTGNTIDPAATFSSSDTSRSQAHLRRSLIALDPLKDVTFEDVVAATSPSATAAPLLAGDGREHEPELPRFPPPERARADWTQSDDTGRSSGGGSGGGYHQQRGGPKLLLQLTPLLRKADSLWALRTGRRGSRDSAAGVGSGADKEEGRKGDGEGGKGNEEKGANESPISSPRTAGRGSGCFAAVCL